MTTKLLDILEQNLIESDKSVNSYISLINSPLFLIDPNFMFKQPKSSQEETILENIKNHTEMMQQLIDILKVKKETITQFLKDNKKKFTITQFTLSQLDGKVTALKKIYKIITKLLELTEKKNITISGVFDLLKESNTDHLKFLERLSAIGSSQDEIKHLVDELKSGIKLSKKSTIKQIKEIIPNLEYILNELKDYDSSLKIQKIINTLPETNFDEFEKFIIDNKLYTSPLNKTLINLVNINRFSNLTLILKKIQKLNISILKIDSLPKNKNFILYRESLTTSLTLLIKMEVINTDNVPLTELKHVLLCNNGELIVANDENELLESYEEIKSKEAKILLTPVNFLIESSNFGTLDHPKEIVTEYNFKFKNTYNCYGKVLSRKNDRMANILNTIKYTFYHDTKFFIEDFIKIRDDSILVKNNTLLNLLSLSNDYRLIIDAISKKKNNQDISTLVGDIANQPFFKEMHTYFKKQELFNFKVKDMPRPSKIVNYLTNIDFEDDLKKEISIFIENFAEMVKKISNANSMIILMALFNMANDVTNTNIFCYDLINSREFNAVEYQKLVSSIINQDYDIHSRLFNQHYTYNSGNSNNNIKLPRLSWTHFDSVGTSAHCSETTLFQLINWLILDYSKSNATKNMAVLEKIKIKEIKDIYKEKTLNSLYSKNNSDKTHIFEKIIKRFHSIFKNNRGKIKTAIEKTKGERHYIELFNSSLALSSHITAENPDEIPAHFLYVYLILDIIFGAHHIIKSDGSVDLADKTFSSFCKFINEINPEIPLTDIKGGEVSIYEPSLYGDKKVSFYLNNKIKFIWSSGHADTGVAKTGNFEDLINRNYQFIHMFNRLCTNVLKINHHILYTYDMSIRKHALNGLFYKLILDNITDHDIINKFILDGKSISEINMRIKYILNNSKKYYRRQIKLKEIEFKYTDVDESKISVDIFKSVPKKEGEIYSILNNETTYDDIIFKTPIDESKKICFENLTNKKDKIAYILKNTGESLSNTIFQKKIFSRHKKFKIDMISKINNDMRKLINDCINTLNKSEVKIRKNQIRFVLKGGMNFYAIYYKFLSNEGDIYPKLKNYFLQKIGMDKRSDFDFTILIDPTLDEETFYNAYYFINKKVAQKCAYYQEILDKNLHIKFDLDDVSFKIKDEVNKLLINEGLEDDLVELIQIESLYGSNTYRTTSDFDFPDNIVNLNRSNDVLRPKEHDEYHESQKPLKKNNYYVTFTPTDGPNKAFLPVLKTMNSNYSSVYYYANEALAFYSNLKSKTGLNNFFLHRIKKNIRIKFLTKPDIVYFFSTGIELLDIAVPTLKDFNHKTFKFDVIETRKYHNTSIDIYNTNGLIEDYIKMFFYQNEYPWLNPKYGKRLDRFIILIIIHNFKNLSELNKLIYILENLDRTKTFTDPINTNIITQIKNLNTKIGDNKSLQDKMTIFVNDILTSLKEIMVLIDSSKSSLGKIYKMKDKKDKISSQIKILKYYSVESSKIIVDTIKAVKEILDDNENNDVALPILETNIKWDIAKNFKYSEKTDFDRNMAKIIKILKTFSKGTPKKKNISINNMRRILVDNKIIQQLLRVYDNPLSILDEDTITNLNTLLEIDFDMEGSKELDGFLSKYKFKFVDI